MCKAMGLNPHQKQKKERRGRRGGREGKSKGKERRKEWGNKKKERVLNSTQYFRE
jgi:hypothetical protein